MWAPKKSGTSQRFYATSAPDRHVTRNSYRPGMNSLMLSFVNFKPSLKKFLNFLSLPLVLDYFSFTQVNSQVKGIKFSTFNLIFRCKKFLNFPKKLINHPQHSAGTIFKQRGPTCKKKNSSLIRLKILFKENMKILIKL